MLHLEEIFADNLQQIADKYHLSLKKIAIAVSGGADSLALAWLSTKYCHKNNIEITALTVNHHLRPEATAEAQMVAELMQKWGIKHNILDWFPPQISGSSEEKARLARYSLLENWCIANNTPYLLTAHHQTDQAETFLIRLQRGSGVDGLASMRCFSPFGKINLIRPLLNICPEDLRTLLKQNHISWAEDASNQCDDFLRNRIRKFLPLLEEKTGISTTRLAQTAQALDDVKQYFEEQVQDFISAYVRYFEQSAASVSPQAFNNLHPQIKIRVLSYLLKKIGIQTYAPEYEELQHLCQRLQNPDFKGCTLGHCEIIPFQKRIWIIRENPEAPKITSQDWQNFTACNPQYAKSVIPYALKCLLLAK